MKKILILFSLLFATFQSVKAQDVQVLDTPPDWPFMMSNLNTTQITSGILYNKVAMSTNLLDYNRGKYNLTHADHFMQGINELYYASGQTKFMSASQLKASLSGTTSALVAQAASQTIAAPIVPSTTATVNVSIINTTLHQLNFNEKDPATGGLTFVNGKFVPIAGQPAFLSRKILLASPLQENVTGTAIKYKFSNALIYNNATTAIKNLVVYFNDNTAVTIINNSALVLASKTISYTTSGSKILRFVATFTDNTTISTAGYHYFTYKNTNAVAQTTTNSLPPCEQSIIERGIYKSTIGFQGYNETAEYLGKFDYTVFYHTINPNGSTNSSERKMLKPILIIDGFDPGDKRKTTDCDCEQNPDCKLENSTKSFVYTPGQIIPAIQYTFNSLNYESIQDLMSYKEIINNETITKNLIVKLNEEGYDVIILNIPKYTTTKTTDAIGTPDYFAIDGGADYVERNGRALASYIQATKAKLVLNNSLENLVIMGPSMGGLISRYALAYMEKKEFEATTPADKASWKHNTRIWVSFDSPHLGANIPLGAQANIWFFGEKLRNSAAEEKFNTQLNSYAGKQMLISQFSNTLATLANGTGYSNNSPYFVQFQNNLNSNGVSGSGGFPVSNSSFRKIAIVNGSLSGAKNGVEGGEFLNVRGYKDPTITEGLIGGAIAGSVIPFIGTGLGALAGGLLGASNANITVLRCRDKFYPAYGQTDDIFNGDGQNFTIGWSQWYINHKWYNLRGINNDLRGSLDVVPAGTFTTGKILRDEIVKGLDDAGLSNEIRGTNIDTHSFIPAFSALAHLQPYQSWSNPLNTNLTCISNKLTPFDSYYGATSNTAHISLTKEMVDWLMKEIGDSTHPPVPQAPYFPLQDNLLTGATTICLNSNETYSFGDICKLPSAVTWTVTPNLQIVSSTGTSIIVKGLTGGSATITATFQNGQKITKSIWVGAPSILAIKNTYNPPGIVSVQLKGINNTDINLQSITNVLWEKVSDNPTNCGDITGTTGFTNEISYSGYNCSTKLKITTTNNCGTNIQYSTIVGSYNAGDPLRPASNQTFYTIYPNPTHNIVNVELKNQDQKTNPNAKIVAELYNMMGEVKRNVTINNNIATIDVSGLPKGIYLLKINIDGIIESHQVGIE